MENTDMMNNVEMIEDLDAQEQIETHLADMRAAHAAVAEAMQQGNAPGREPAAALDADLLREQSRRDEERERARAQRAEDEQDAADLRGRGFPEAEIANLVARRREERQRAEERKVDAQERREWQTRHADAAARSTQQLAASVDEVNARFRDMVAAVVRLAALEVHPRLHGSELVHPWGSVNLARVLAKAAAAAAKSCDASAEVRAALNLRPWQ